MRTLTFLSLTTTVLLSTACDRSTAPASEQTPAPEHAASSDAASSDEPSPDKAAAELAGDKKPSAAPAHAEESADTTTASIGQPAPAFHLPDLAGKTHSLSDYQGKPVVLEWFNPGCPFVKAAHTEGSLVSTAAELEKKGFVYLAINSGGPGKQGHGQEANAAGQKSFGLKHPILLDETGATGKAYGATNTPHIYVIDQKGTLVYAGAVDNSPDGEGKSPEGGTLINYLTQAADELLAGKPITTPSTKAYGCGVKYSN